MTCDLIQPAVVLVVPQMGENIGMTARAMLNCGLTDLRLVRPRDGWPSESATKASSGAAAVIDHVRVFETVAAAVGDCTYVVATTARQRDMVKPVITPQQAVQTMRKVACNTAAGGKTAMIFGGERSGLDNDDLVHADALVTIPLNPDFSSLNLSQAVLLLAYEWFTQTMTASPAVDQGGYDLFIADAPMATKHDIDFLVNAWVGALDEVGFYPTAAQKPSMTRNLANTFQRMRLTAQEARTFHGMLRALRKALPR